MNAEIITYQIYQIKDLQHFEEIIESGDTVMLTNVLSVRGWKQWVDRKPKIDIYYGPFIPYSLKRLDEIMKAIYETTAEEYIKQNQPALIVTKEGFGH